MDKQVAGIEAAVTRAIHLARGPVKFEHIRKAITQGAIPSDRAFSIALSNAPVTARQRTLKAKAKQIQEPCTTAARTVQTTGRPNGVDLAPDHAPDF